MSKAILIMNMPECCGDCNLVEDDAAGLFCIPADKYFDGRDSSEEKMECCPFRELPEKMEVCGKYPQPDGIVPSYKAGWNACIDSIEGSEANG